MEVNNIQSVLVLFVIVLCGILVSLLLLLLRRKVIDSYVKRWALENRFQLIGYKGKSIYTCPISSPSSRAQSVVLAEVDTSQGVRKKVWLKIGNYIYGLFSYRVEFMWDKQRQQ